MKLYQYGDIPEFISEVFADIVCRDLETLNVKNEKELFGQDQDDSNFLVITHTPDIESLIKKTRFSFPKSKIFVYGVSDSKETTRLMRLGVEYCFSKKVSREQVKAVLLKIIYREDSIINQKIHKYRWFVGDSNSISELKTKINESVRNNKNIILAGPAGTGKLNIAKIIHECGYQNRYHFKVLNLAAYEEDYLNGQFWVSFKNLFEEIDTDIDGLKSPLFSTIYIEGLSQQSKDFKESLVEFIKKYQDKVNQDNVVGFAPRIIVSIQADKDYSIPSEIKKYYYILHLPSLEERKEDIPLLIYTMVRKYSDKHNKIISNISLEAFNVLLNYNWPGNILELQSIIESAVLTSKNGVITGRDIGINMNMLFQSSQKNVLGKYLPLKTSMQNFQKLMIQCFLECSYYDYNKTSTLLGLNKNELFNKMNTLGISV